MSHAKHEGAGEGAVHSADHTYAVAVAMKQCKCDEKEAKSKLKAVDEAALVAAGRAGNVAEVRTMLGL